MCKLSNWSLTLKYWASNKTYLKKQISWTIIHCCTRFKYKTKHDIVLNKSKFLNVKIT